MQALTKLYSVTFSSTVKSISKQYCIISPKHLKKHGALSWYFPVSFITLFLCRHSIRFSNNSLKVSAQSLQIGVEISIYMVSHGYTVSDIICEYQKLHPVLCFESDIKRSMKVLWSYGYSFQREKLPNRPPSPL